MVHIHAIRLLGVAYVGMLSFVISYLASHWLDKITPPLNEKKAKWKIFVEVALQFGLIGALIYLARGLIEKVPLGSDVAFQAHHKLFADRIDRRVRYLREELFKVGVD